MTPPFPRLFSPLRLGPREARNRIVSTPHTTGFGVGGFPRERWLAYEREKARGGAGTIMMFGSASVHPSSPVAAAGGIEYWDPAIVPHLRAMADGVHECGGLCLAQVSHWGRGGDGRYADEPLLAPSDEPDETHHGIPRALTKAEIHVLIDAFGQAARHVKAGGYDGVDLSCWGGHLTEQFLSPVSNRRTDEYGGSLENRLRFCLETLEAVRGAVGADLIVGARLTGDQMVPGGLTLEDTQAIAARLAGTGWLDYVTVSGASTERYQALPYVTPTYYAPLGLYNRFAAAVKAVVRIPVIVAGRVVHPAQAEEVLAAGLGGRRRDDARAHRGSRDAAEGRRGADRRDPDLHGRERGLHRPAHPGKDDRVHPEPSDRPRGGAGRDPARRAPPAGRGGGWRRRRPGSRAHGGSPRPSRGPARGDGGARRPAPRALPVTGAAELRGGRPLASRRGRSRGRRGAPRDRGDGGRDPRRVGERTDAVVVATGSRPRPSRCPWPTARTSSRPRTCCWGGRRPGRRVLVVDYQGHMAGPGAAEALADRGHQVEVVTRFFSVGEDVDPRLKTSVYTRFYQKGVAMTPLSVVQEVGVGWVRLANTLTNQERTVEVDTVVTALGGRAENALEARARRPRPRGPRGRRRPRATYDP